MEYKLYINQAYEKQKVLQPTCDKMLKLISCTNLVYYYCYPVSQNMWKL